MRHCLVRQHDDHLRVGLANSQRDELKYGHAQLLHVGHAHADGNDDQCFSGGTWDFESGGALDAMWNASPAGLAYASGPLSFRRISLAAPTWRVWMPQQRMPQ